ncbi:MAG: thioredoxin TrxA [Anaerolineae bacterium]
MIEWLRRRLRQTQEPSGFARSTERAAEKVHPYVVTDADFASVILESSLPAVVDFWADWCMPCHMMSPAVDRLAREFEGRALVAKLNVDENPETPARYEIMGIPTVIFFHQGREVDRVIGVVRYGVLASRLNAILAASEPS